jgi:hypothetical protein
VSLAAHTGARWFPLGRAEVGLSVLVAAAALAIARGYPVWREYVHVACPTLVVFGVPCPTCGATRAFAALAVGQWGEALSWNPGAGLAALLLLLWIPAGLVILAGGAPPPAVPSRLPGWIRGAIPLLIAANWVYLLFWFRG